MDSEVVERVATPRGELALRRSGDALEIISNGVFLMDTRSGSSERLLAGTAVEGREGPLRVLLGGLGVGFSLAEALRHPQVGEVTVVELEQAVIDWQRTYLATYAGVGVADPRATVVHAGFHEWLCGGTSTYDAICLDVDNGPDWTVTPANTSLYGSEGLALLESRLASGGVLTVWSASASPTFEERLRARFAEVRVLTVDVPRGEPDHIYLAR